MAALRRFLADVPSVKVAFGSVGAGYGNLLAAIKGTGVLLMITNTLNQEITMSLDGGTTDWIFVPAGYSFTIDLGTNGAEYYGTVSIKHSGVAPTSGFIAGSILRVS